MTTRCLTELDSFRCGVESLISQASRRSDLHQARYRGLAKSHLQHVLTALAINLVRVDAWLTGVATTGSWTSRLARLGPNPYQQPEFASRVKTEGESDVLPRDAEGAGDLGLGVASGKQRADLQADVFERLAVGSPRALRR